MRTLLLSRLWDITRPVGTCWPSYAKASSFSIPALNDPATRCMTTSTVASSVTSHQHRQQQQRGNSFGSSGILLQQGCLRQQKAWVSRSRSESSSSSGSGSGSRSHHVWMSDRRYHEDSSVRAKDKSKPLPKLPVPEVEATLQKYLSVLSTVLTPHELRVTTGHVLEFMTPGGRADTLQSYLMKRRATVDNWAYYWWLHDMYLSIRLPLPINVNPGTLCDKQHFDNRQQYLRYAARLVRGVLDYKSMVDSGTLPVETAGRTGRALCMQQYYAFLHNSRRAAHPVDQLITNLNTRPPASIITACKGQFYKIDVEKDGILLTEGELCSQLGKVMATAAQHHAAGSPSVGVLTALDRSTWAEAREKLAEDPGNKQNLDAMENGFLLLCLDETFRGSFHKPSQAEAGTPGSGTPGAGAGATLEGGLQAREDKDKGEKAETEEEYINQAHWCLHGGGTALNSCNRWFDKTLQVLVSEDGASGLNTEHTLSEASVPYSITAHLQKFCDSQGPYEGKGEEEGRSLEEPQWLKWTTTPEIEDHIARAKEDMDRSVRNIDIGVQDFYGFGKEFAKSQGVSPDAFVQLALQFAYYRMHGGMAMTYESAGLRRFRKGRVDNIRANLPAALEWVKAMCGEVPATMAEKQALFKRAAEGQQKYQTEAISGFGMDCHLIGLREAARELDVLDSIPMFSDPAFQKAFQFAMSTSQVPEEAPTPGLYGPTAPHGYGIPYNLFPDSMLFVVTSFRDCAETDSQKFITCLLACLSEMRDICLLRN